MTRVVRARPEVAALTAYTEKAPNGLNLSNNTNVFGPNPAIRRALDLARDDGFWDYPSLASDDLRGKVARAHGVDAANVVTGNGSNDVIDLIVRTFTSHGDRVAFHPPTFGMIPFFARAHGASPAPVPLAEADAWALDADAMVAARGRVTFICTPNNPTGNAFPREDVLRVVRDADGLVVVDEAYVEFSGQRSLAHDVPEHDNLVVLRTFSKAYGLAGLRAGYGVMPTAVAAECAKVRGPFRLNAFSELAATLALDETAYLAGVVEGVRQGRERITKTLQSEGFTVYPSDSNFILFRPNVDAHRLAGALAARGVHVREFTGDMSPFTRVTVGPPDVLDRFEAALADALKEVRA